MRVLKMIIVGQILAALTTYYHYRDQLSEEEKQDFNELKKCADILQHRKQETVIHKLTHNASIIELELALFAIIVCT